MICKAGTHEHRIGDLLNLRPGHRSTRDHLTVNGGFSDKS